MEEETDGRLAWVRGPSRPESRWAANGYFILTLLSLPVFPLVMIWKAVVWRKKPSEFRAQPYTHLAQILRERGDDDAARKVEAEKMWQGAVDRADATRHGMLWRTYWWRPYGVMFGYGLSPIRALLSVLGVLAVCWICVSLMSFNGMLQKTKA